MRELKTKQTVTHWFVEMVSNGVSKSTNGIIEDEEILGLVLGEGRHEHLGKDTDWSRVEEGGGEQTCRISAR